MPKISENYDIGNLEELTVEELGRLVTDIYRDLAIAINKKPDIYERSTNGQSSDTFLSNGDININKSTNRVEMLTNRPTSSTVTWTTLS